MSSTLSTIHIDNYRVSPLIINKIPNNLNSSVEANSFAPADLKPDHLVQTLNLNPQQRLSYTYHEFSSQRVCVYLIVSGVMTTTCCCVSTWVFVSEYVSSLTHEIMAGFWSVCISKATWWRTQFKLQQLKWIIVKLSAASEFGGISKLTI